MEKKGIQTIKKDKIIQGTRYVDTHTFKSGVTVPIYEVDTTDGLNQIIGYVKYINRDYGTVYYRGEAKLHEGLTPALYRNAKTKNSGPLNERVNKLVTKIASDKKLSKELGLLGKSKDWIENAVGGLLQHYGIATAYIDVVDNHWIALWFGQYGYEMVSERPRVFARYTQRRLPRNNYAFKFSGPDENELYQYILLVAADKGENEQGITRGEDVITVNLREVLPSVFIRPHAQHGVVIKKKRHKPAEDWGLDRNVVCILQIRIDVAKEWLGDGELISQKNLFPSAMDDQGYRILLRRDDIFNDEHRRIVEYVY